MEIEKRKVGRPRNLKVVVDKRPVGRQKSRYEPTKKIHGDVTHYVFDRLDAYCRFKKAVKCRVVEKAIIEFLDRNEVEK